MHDNTVKTLTEKEKEWMRQNASTPAIWNANRQRWEFVRVERKIEHECGTMLCVRIVRTGKSATTWESSLRNFYARPLLDNEYIA